MPVSIKCPNGNSRPNILTFRRNVEQGQSEKCIKPKTFEIFHQTRDFHPSKIKGPILDSLQISNRQFTFYYK